MTIHKYLKNYSPLLLDGAMGTLLDKRGYSLPAPVWSAEVVESDPEAVTQVHRDYLEAGARILTTATFRTTHYVYEKIGDPEKAESLTRRAVKCTRDAIEGQPDRFVAGSVAPLEDCYRPDLVPDDEILYREHRSQISWLTDAGVDCLLIETMNTIREAETCARIAGELEIPAFVSFVCNSPESIISGESVTMGAEAVIPYEPLGVLVNCTTPELITALLGELHSAVDHPLGAYANVGESEPEQGGTISGVISPDRYGRYVRDWLR